MTPRSAFLVALKIIGLFLLKDTIVFAYSLFVLGYTVAFSGPYGGGFSTSSINGSLLMPLGIFLGYLCLTFLFLFKPRLIVDLLRLDRGFDK